MDNTKELMDLKNQIMEHLKELDKTISNIWETDYNEVDELRVTLHLQEQGSNRGELMDSYGFKAVYDEIITAQEAYDFEQYLEGIRARMRSTEVKKIAKQELARRENLFNRLKDS